MFFSDDRRSYPGQPAQNRYTVPGIRPPEFAPEFAAILGIAPLSKIARSWFKAAPRVRWTPPRNFHMPAPEKGRFIGDVGNSHFAVADDAADAMGIPRGSVIPWKQGTPDFGRFAIPGPGGVTRSFPVRGLTGEQRADRILAIKQMALQSNMSQRGIEWLAKNEASLHHAGGETIQIVPTKVHSYLHHQGGAAEARRRQ